MSFAELMGIDNEYVLLSKTEKVCQHINIKYYIKYSYIYTIKK